MLLTNRIVDRATGTFIGLAIGDALGTTLEFTKRDSAPAVTDMVGGGYFGLKPGEWTDDTSLALCVAESFIHCRAFNAKDMASRCINWMDWGINSVTGTCFDVGDTTRQSLESFRQTGIAKAVKYDQEGNGSIMRLAPSVLCSLTNREEAIHNAVAQSTITHMGPETLDACAFLGATLYDQIHGIDGPTPDLNTVAIRTIAAGSYCNKPRSDIRSTGYVADTLEAALWAVSMSDSFEQAVLTAVNLGDDADTVGAVTGQIAGAKWGLSGIPPRWVAQLARAEHIEKLAIELTQIGFPSVPQLTHGPGMP